MSGADRFRDQDRVLRSWFLKAMLLTLAIGVCLGFIVGWVSGLLVGAGS